jgi:hypothetical protein
MIWDFGDATGDQAFAPTHRFSEKKIYSIRLIAVNDCGRDTIFKSIDLRPNGVNDPTQAIDFQCFPNPFNDNLTVQFYLSEQSNISFELYDISGKLVEILAQKAHYTEGGYQQSFSPRDMPKGVYFLKLKTDKQVIYKQIVKI